MRVQTPEDEKELRRLQAVERAARSLLEDADAGEPIGVGLDALRYSLAPKPATASRLTMQLEAVNICIRGYRQLMVNHGTYTPTALAIVNHAIAGAYALQQAEGLER